MPTLAETLGLLSGRAAVDVEIKNIPGEPDFDAERELAVEAVHRCLDEVGFVGDVMVSSFNPPVDRREPRGAGPRSRRGCSPSIKWRPRRRCGSPPIRVTRGCCLSSSRSSRRAPGSPARFTTPGLLLGTWITDDPAEAVALGGSGVDAVATNDPRRVVAAVVGAAGR